MTIVVIVSLFVSLIDAQACAVLFVSSSMATGDIGGFSGGDALCSTLFRANGNSTFKVKQQAFGISFQFVAWLRALTSDASDRIRRANATFGGCVENVRSDRLADTLDAFQSGNLMRAPSVDEAGRSVAASKVFTSTQRNGTYFAGGDGSACANWTAAEGGVKSVYGLSDKTDASWSADGTDNCNNKYRIYCFG